MKHQLLILALASTVALANPAPISFEPSAAQPSMAPFRAQSNYLAMNLPANPFQKIKGQVATILGLTLIDRDEAHVTVLSPVEMPLLTREGNCTSQGLQLEARDSGIQKAKIEYLGLGSGQINQRGTQSTFFVVIKSEDLVELRRHLKEMCAPTSSFDPEHFYPHVTVGFTSRDLFEQDGVIKDERSIDPRFELQLTRTHP